ncbi:MAG: hypothetical protein AAFY71_21960 [Bacteroidota bacterium]
MFQRTFAFLLLCFFTCLQFPSLTWAQGHLYPKDQEAGIPGPERRSFVFGWEKIEGAIGYEYVLSDNRLCFAGCSGDTRQKIVEDTFAVEEGLIEGIPYFWITRIHFANGDTSAWSFITSFQANTPEVGSILTLTPNPSVNGDIDFELDWAAINDLAEIRISVWNTKGEQVLAEERYRADLSVFRIQPLKMRAGHLKPGMYFLFVQSIGSDGFSFQPQWKRVILQAYRQ